MPSTAQVARMATVANDLAVMKDWKHEPAPERWLTFSYAELEVRVRLGVHLEGMDITLHIPTPDGSMDVVWVGIVSHRLGEGYATELVAAMVQCYLCGYIG